jgi:hypothetical protein
MYDGKIMVGIPLPKDLRWAETRLILMEGSTLCGHAVLQIGDYYFHFAGPSRVEYPKMFTAGEFKAYLSQRGKHVIGYYNMDIAFPKLAEAELRNLLDRKWQTFVIAHNCATFVKEIIYAGGNRRPFQESCPTSWKNLPNPNKQVELEKWFANQGNR